MLNSSGAYGAELLGVQNEQLILLCVISQVKISFIIVCVSAVVGFFFLDKQLKMHSRNKFWVHIGHGKESS